MPSTSSHVTLSMKKIVCWFVFTRICEYKMFVHVGGKDTDEIVIIFYFGIQNSSFDYLRSSDFSFHA